MPVELTERTILLGVEVTVAYNIEYGYTDQDLAEIMEAKIKCAYKEIKITDVVIKGIASGICKP